ncbi:hypothetical protein FIBSPDRAFT_865713 [Athelia psychrophila]|uniref:Uncharacterized protein n=1 Tax=Athelia psychrophila TaxID=1759441 RepID=A0A166FF32_9AGAM|nr:hypothetical protein FIBSPDRAFT_865713 [Fibularhizoctonia sp. CBS 109695]
MTLGGYWVALDALRKLAEKLHIDLGERTTPNPGNYGRSINNWLCDNKPDSIPTIKAEGIDWPPKGMRFGVIFISKLARQDYHVPLEEDADDLMVKEWLQREGADEAVWATLPDPWGIAAGGIHPEKCTYEYIFVTRPPKESR